MKDEKKEMGIMFTEEMLRQIVSGKKTVTRRLVNPQPVLKDTDSIGQQLCLWKDKSTQIHINSLRHYFKYGTVGDRMYVKETFTEIRLAGRKKHTIVLRKIDEGVVWKSEGVKLKWKSKLFMPKKYARIWLEITSIRVERLKTIAVSVEDIENEGFSHINDFVKTWNKITTSEKFKWHKNPWVWVISFRMIDKR